MDLLKIELLIMRMRITWKIIIVYRDICFLVTILIKPIDLISQSVLLPILENIF